MQYSKRQGKIEVVDGAAGARGVNQFYVRKIVDGTAHYYNKGVLGYWAAYCTILTKQEAKVVAKFMRKHDKKVNASVRKKVDIKVRYCSDTNAWTVDATTGLLGTCVSFVRKPSRKQLAKLRTALATANFNTRLKYSVEHGKFI